MNEMMLNGGGRALLPLTVVTSPFFVTHHRSQGGKPQRKKKNTPRLAPVISTMLLPAIVMDFVWIGGNDVA